MEKKRIYVSDIHMGAGKKPSTGTHEYDWLGANEANRFADFIEHLAASDAIGEVILLGDAMDNWVCPVDDVPPTFDEILDAAKNKRIKDGLNGLAKKAKVVLMPGNHDMLITKKVLDKHLPDVLFGGSAANKSTYRTSRLLAEHGSSYAMFNAPDPINNPGNRLPLGYFISRAVATKMARTGDAKRHWWTYADDLLETLGPQKLPQSVFEAVLEECDIPEDQEILMPPIGGKPARVKASDVKAKYADLYEQWKNHYGKGMAFKAVMAEIGYLGDLADTLSKKSDTNVVIFGHSHEGELDKDSWFVKDRIYANCGHWCDDNDKACTFVESQKNDKKREHVVRLMRWDAVKKKAEKLKEESVAL